MTGVDEEDQISRWLKPDGMPGEEDQNRVFDQSGKADDAVDYEDFDMSEDDLPEEELATNGAANEEDPDLNSFLQQASGFGSLPVANGHHDTADTSGDLFGDADEGNDLFGDLTSSPEAERHPSNVPQPQQRPSALALPTKSAGLALPALGKNYSQPSIAIKRSPSSSSPPLFADRDLSALSPASSTDDEDDSLEAIQRRMLRDAGRKARGEDVGPGSFEPDVELFNKLFPTYEESEAPKFLELFPPRHVHYKGKAPLKPPKIVQPTKISLDLLHDQERTFKAAAIANKAGQESSYNESFIKIGHGDLTQDDSDDEDYASILDDGERVGNVAMQDLILICQDWDVPSIDSTSVVDFADSGDWNMVERARPAKKHKSDKDYLSADVPLELHDSLISFEEPERTTSKVAKSVSLDLNDPNLLIDEHAPQTKRKLRRLPGNKRDAALSRDIAKRYNISNDEAYDQLKQNNQNQNRKQPLPAAVGP